MRISELEQLVRDFAVYARINSTRTVSKSTKSEAIHLSHNPTQEMIFDEVYPGPFISEKSNLRQVYATQTSSGCINIEPVRCREIDDRGTQPDPNNSERIGRINFAQIGVAQPNSSQIEIIPSSLVPPISCQIGIASNDPDQTTLERGCFRQATLGQRSDGEAKYGWPSFEQLRFGQNRFQQVPFRKVDSRQEIQSQRVAKKGSPRDLLLYCRFEFTDPERNFLWKLPVIVNRGAATFENAIIQHLDRFNGRTFFAEGPLQITYIIHEVYGGGVFGEDGLARDLFHTTNDDIWNDFFERLIKIEMMHYPWPYYYFRVFVL